MVRTVLCHPFVEQKNFTDQYDASCICCTNDDKVLIGSLYGSISIIDLKGGTHNVLHKFPSNGIPIKMLFSDDKQFLVSLESKLQDYRVGLSAREMNCQARVYSNIMLGNPQKNVAPLSSGYSINRHNNNHTRNKFSVIDFAGLRQPATDIALCNSRHNVAISSSKKIYLYAFKEVMSADLPEDDSVLTIDFIRMVEVETTINIRSVAFSLNWIAFASKTEIRVIQVYLHQPSDEKVYQGEDVSELLDDSTTQTDGLEKTTVSVLTSKPSKSNNMPVQTTLWDFDQATSTSSINEFESKGGHGMMQMQSIQEEKPYIDTKSSSKEVTGEHTILVGHPLCCSFLGQMPTKEGHVNYATVTSTTHLYRRFEEDDISFSGNTERIHSLQWLPIFLEDIAEHKQLEVEEKMPWPWNAFLKPHSFPVLLSMPLFFSTGTHGYLYDTWNSKGLILDYSYTSDCLSAKHTNSLLYTVTSNGLEIFTSRLYPFVSGCTKEMFKECKFSKNAEIANKAGKAKQPYRARDRGPTEIFLETNYFMDYVSVNKDLSMIEDGGLGPSNDIEPRKRTHSSAYDRYPYQWLLKTCPPKDLETCLVGMYPYQDVVCVATSMSFVLMFIKVPKRTKEKGGATSSPWSVCSFEKHISTDVGQKITKLIEESEFSNPMVYYHLLCESHLLLCCDLMSRPNDEILIKALKSSAVSLATFLMRCEPSFDFTSVKGYFEMAGMQPTAVLEHMKNENIRLERKKHSFGTGMIEYLNNTLFGKEQVQFDKNICDFIINVYGKNHPSMLAKVILKSNLPRLYSIDLCVKLMSKYKRKKESKEQRLQPLDSLCFAYLHMDLGNPGHAEELLKELEKDDLLKICISNTEVLFNSQYQLTPMGQLMKKHFKESFQSIVISLFDTRTIDLNNILQIFQAKRKAEDNEKRIPLDRQACQILENLLNDSSRRKSFQEIAVILVDQYLLRMTKKMNTNDGWKIKHNHEIKGNGHYGTRFTWLNKLKPFSGESPSPQDCIILKNNQKSRSNDTSGGTGRKQNDQQSMALSLPSTGLTTSNPSSPSRSKILSPSSMDDTNHETSKILKSREFCPCCCCSEILIKFQSLLCSRYNRKEFSLHVIEKLKDSDFVGKEALLLLAWPKAGMAQEAVDYIVANYPALILQYAKDMFDWKAQWQQLLQCLLEYIRANKFEPWNYDVYMETLKGVLMRLARAFSPKDFLNMLPSDMNVNFMLPYLAECNEFHRSSSLKSQILQTYKTQIEIHENL
ncbi:BLOC-2 complex member HPS3-like isoform X2 [Clytia hemisphaerica]|uniref:BLOC-2 complex member HPS3-like isoform X2 n=1 Tax=Clytia hemisphaerica TaxID=252671 RepID=UPI0034D3CEBC